MGTQKDQATLQSGEPGSRTHSGVDSVVHSDAETEVSTDRIMAAATAATGGSSTPHQVGLEVPAPPSTMDRYVTRSVLGRGGMGEVMLCEDSLIGRDVALKRMHAEIRYVAGAEQRFLREALVQARIEHPSVVPVYDLGAGADGSTYFTMRRIRGRTLEQILEGLAEADEEMAARFSRRRLLTAFVSVCMAVHYAHTRGVVHRDLKPGNIMFGDFGEVYVLDWGIAKVQESASGDAEPVPLSARAPAALSWTDSSGEKLTAVGQMVGTVGYMAPEQMRGKEVDGRADVYSLGVILYEMLKLERLHPPCSLPEVYQAVLSGIATSVDAGDLPPELDTLWRRACALRSEDRFQSAKELADAIERFLDGDRDLEQRRKLAREHGERAEAAVARAFSDGLAAGEATAARVEATTEVMKVLALQPGDKVARRMLARLLVEAPDEMPPEAEDAMRKSTVETRLHGIRAGLLGFVSWLVCVPLAMLLGVRDWLPLSAIAATLVLGTAFNVWIIRKRVTSTWAVMLLASLAMTVVVISSSWLGPFVVVPTAAAVTTLLFATQAARRERMWFMVVGVVGASLPYVLDLTGAVPKGFAFQDGGIVLFQRAFALSPAPTLIALIYASVSFCIVPAVYVGRLRDSLSRAERKLFLHAWQLSRLASD